MTLKRRDNAKYCNTVLIFGNSFSVITKSTLLINCVCLLLTQESTNYSSTNLFIGSVQLFTSINSCNSIFLFLIKLRFTTNKLSQTKLLPYNFDNLKLTLYAHTFSPIICSDGSYAMILFVQFLANHMFGLFLNYALIRHIWEWECKPNRSIV